MGTVSYIVYILIGIAGLPVFSGFTSGVGALTGPTAGFIWGFLLGVPVFYIFEKYFSRKKVLTIIGYIIYILIHYIPGALWYCRFTAGEINMPGLISSSLVTVVPFIVPDGIKLLVAILTTDAIIKAKSEFKQMFALRLL